LRERFITKLVLVTLNLDKEMRVEANISDFAIKKVRNYKIHNKKMLTIIRCLET